MMRLFASLVCLCLSVYGYANNASSEWKKICKEAKAEIPKKDFPTEEERSKLSSCNTEALYYGIGMPPDYVKARHCALSKKSGEVFAGTDILMMLYGNGQGVERNLDLALRFACETSAAPAEMMIRIDLLHEMKTNSSKKIDVCETITSGLMVGFCEGLKQRIADVKRKDRLQAVIEKISAANKDLFANLEKASQDFAKTRGAKEVDAGGTAAAAYMIAEEAILTEDYIQMLEAYSKGKANTYTEKQLQEREKKMQAILSKIASRKKQEDYTYGQVTPEKVKVVQAAWEKYRDAFAAFAAAEYKGVRDHSVKGWLTAKRVHMLNNVEKSMSLESL